jgi:hypothetical protein
MYCKLEFGILEQETVFKEHHVIENEELPSLEIHEIVMVCLSGHVAYSWGFIAPLIYSGLNSSSPAVRSQNPTYIKPSRCPQLKIWFLTFPLHYRFIDHQHDDLA